MRLGFLVCFGLHPKGGSRLPMVTLQMLLVPWCFLCFKGGKAEVTPPILVFF